AIAAHSRSGVSASAPSLRDIAHTLQVGRDAMACRQAFVATTLADLAEQLGRFIDHGTASKPHNELAAAFMRGETISWPADPLARRIPLPLYPFANARYRLDRRDAVPAGRLHPFVAENCSNGSVLAYRTTFRGDEFVLADHVVGGRHLLPATA